MEKDRAKKIADVELEVIPEHGKMSATFKKKGSKNAIPSNGSSINVQAKFNARILQDKPQLIYSTFWYIIEKHKRINHSEHININKLFN